MTQFFGSLVWCVWVTPCGPDPHDLVLFFCVGDDLWSGVYDPVHGNSYDGRPRPFYPLGNRFEPVRVETFAEEWVAR